VKVKITRESIELGDRSVPYYAYYFDQWWNDDAKDRLIVVKKVLSQWADALDNATEGQALYLPYSLDDQEVESFKAEVHGNEVTLRCVEVNWNGYSIALDDLSDFIYQTHELWNESPEIFGVYDKEDLIAALRDPELSDS
jgi:hypothetical protein